MVFGSWIIINKKWFIALVYSNHRYPLPPSLFVYLTRFKLLHFKSRIYLCEITNVFGYDNTNSYKSIKFKYGNILRQYDLVVNYLLNNKSIWGMNVDP